MDRLVRSMFNEHISIDKYTEIIVDYVKMGESLHVEIDKKIPSDVIRLHDLFSDQIQFIKDAAIEAAFSKATRVTLAGSITPAAHKFSKQSLRAL